MIRFDMPEEPITTMHKVAMLVLQNSPKASKPDVWRLERQFIFL